MIAYNLTFRRNNLKTIEEKIYECLGIKKFKKVVISLGRYVRKNQKISKGDNYFLYKLNTDSIKDYKENGIKVNSFIHGGAVLFCLFNLVTAHSTVSITINVLGGVVNLYCVMLQRYNNIRLNRIYEKMKEREEQRNTKNIELDKKNNELSLKKEPTLLSNNLEIEYLKETKNYLLNQQVLDQNNNSSFNQLQDDNYKIKIKK
ncbi:MAG: hypothetical protein PHO63_05935 [Bacilli bacterium]|nr:hypothetical protein [Bacilli bacterium]MDD4809489.1 hypothetical protein [Bacilli bacterium]